MEIDDVKRECMAMAWPLRQDDGNYLMNDGVLESMIGIAYTFGQMEGAQSAHERAMAVMDKHIGRVTQ
jgi:hypothetical protein